MRRARAYYVEKKIFFLVGQLFLCSGHPRTPGMPDIDQTASGDIQKYPEVTKTIKLSPLGVILNGNRLKLSKSDYFSVLLCTLGNIPYFRSLRISRIQSDAQRR